MVIMTKNLILTVEKDGKKEHFSTITEEEETPKEPEYIVEGLPEEIKETKP